MFLNYKYASCGVALANLVVVVVTVWLNLVLFYPSKTAAAG